LRSAWTPHRQSRGRGSNLSHSLILSCPTFTQSMVAHHHHHHLHLGLRVHAASVRRRGQFCTEVPGKVTTARYHQLRPAITSVVFWLGRLSNAKVSRAVVPTQTTSYRVHLTTPKRPAPPASGPRSTVSVHSPTNRSSLLRRPSGVRRRILVHRRQRRSA
jgi:hypothetical protein